MDNIFVSSTICNGHLKKRKSARMFMLNIHCKWLNSIRDLTNKTKILLYSSHTKHSEYESAKVHRGEEQWRKRHKFPGLNNQAISNVTAVSA